MGIIKDITEYSEGYTVRWRVITSLSPKVWLKTRKWRKQRADRGWSERDAWDAGQHIAGVVVQTLDYLDRHGMGDYDRVFKEDIRHKDYNSISELTADIKGYLAFQQYGFSDGLDLGFKEVNGQFQTEYRKDGKLLTKKQVNKIVQDRLKAEAQLEKKAKRAMKCFAENFTLFWD